MAVLPVKLIFQQNKNKCQFSAMLKAQSLI